MGRGGCGADPVRSPVMLSAELRQNLADNVWQVDETNLATSNLTSESKKVVFSKEDFVNFDRSKVDALPGSISRRPNAKKNTTTIIPIAEVAKHNKAGDCWLVVKNKVYDVSTFGSEHPGGNVIHTYAGKDATDVFTTFHAASTFALLPHLHIGELESAGPPPDLVKDFRELRISLLREKLFDSSKVYYAWKVASTVSLLLASICLVSYSGSLPVVLTSAAILGLFWQQCGWLAHDFLHHQVFKSRQVNNLLGGYVFGNFFQGFSQTWWKRKHNTHHAAPNECDEEFKPVDPDIDTLPLLAFSTDMLKTVDSKGVRAYLRWQTELFLPILLFARFAWLHSSWTYVRQADMPAGKRARELSTLVLHYVFFWGLAFLILPVPKAILWILSSQLISGAMLGIVFVQSHNGMEIYNDTKDFYSAQIVSTRDIQGSLFNDWFTGGLNRQIEHHLFPTLPRHNLGIAADRVRALCNKHGLIYENVGMVTGTCLVLQRLAEVAAAA